MWRAHIIPPNLRGKVLEKVNQGGPLSIRKFFSMGEITIAGCKARTLAHGMGDAESDTADKTAAVKPNVERHRQITVGAAVHPWPIHEATRMNYRSRK